MHDCITRPRSNHFCVVCCENPPSRGFFGLCVAPLQNRFCLEYQAAWKRGSGCAGERGGARADKPRCVSILTITAGSSMAAMILNSPPHCGQCSRSISRTGWRISNRSPTGFTTGGSWGWPRVDRHKSGNWPRNGPLFAGRPGGAPA